MENNIYNFPVTKQENPEKPEEYEVVKEDLTRQIHEIVEQTQQEIEAMGIPLQAGSVEEAPDMSNVVILGGAQGRMQKMREALDKIEQAGRAVEPLDNTLSKAIDRHLHEVGLEGDQFFEEYEKTTAFLQEVSDRLQAMSETVTRWGTLYEKE